MAPNTEVVKVMASVSMRAIPCNASACSAGETISSTTPFEAGAVPLARGMISAAKTETMSAAGRTRARSRRRTEVEMPSLSCETDATR